MQSFQRNQHFPLFEARQGSELDSNNEGYFQEGYMHGVTCELNQSLVLLERTKASPSFSSRIIYGLSNTCDDCCH